MSDDCRCDRTESTFRGTLRDSTEGAGLTLYCDGCGGWVEDSWLFSDGIPVQVTVESTPTYTGEWLTTYALAPVGQMSKPAVPAE